MSLWINERRCRRSKRNLTKTDQSPLISDELPPSPLLDLPPELRLMVYEWVQAMNEARRRKSFKEAWGHIGTGFDYCDLTKWSVDGRSVIERRGSWVSESRSLTGRGELSQTCRLINNEVHPLLYKPAFAIKLVERTRGAYHGVVTHTGLDFLRHVTRLHLHIEVAPNDLERLERNESAPGVATDVYLLQDMLDILKESTALETVSFEVAGFAGMYSKYRALATTFKEARRKSTREGVQAGKDWKERELDCAQVVVDALKELVQGMKV
jgi:hypothetical protein